MRFVPAATANGFTQFHCKNYRTTFKWNGCEMTFSESSHSNRYSILRINGDWKFRWPHEWSPLIRTTEIISHRFFAHHFTIRKHNANIFVSFTEWWKWEKTISQVNVVYLHHYTLSRGETDIPFFHSRHTTAHTKNSNISNIDFPSYAPRCSAGEWKTCNIFFFHVLVCLSHGMWSFPNAQGS